MAMALRRASSRLFQVSSQGANRTLRQANSHTSLSPDAVSHSQVSHSQVSHSQDTYKTLREANKHMSDNALSWMACRLEGIMTSFIPYRHPTWVLRSCYRVFGDVSGTTKWDTFVGILIRDEFGRVVYRGRRQLPFIKTGIDREIRGQFTCMEVFESRFPKVKHVEFHIDNLPGYNQLNGKWEGPSKSDAKYEDKLKRYKGNMTTYAEHKRKFTHMEVCQLNRYHPDMLEADALSRGVFRKFHP